MKKLLLLFGILFIVCCSSPDTRVPRHANFDIDAARDYIVEANKSYENRFQTTDTSYYNNLYCTDACIMPVGMSKICGVANINSYYYNNGQNKNFKLIITAQNIFGTSEVVVEEGVYLFNDTSGKTLDNGKFIALWKVESGNLKMYREIWNSDKVSK